MSILKNIKLEDVISFLNNVWFSVSKTAVLNSPAIWNGRVKNIIDESLEDEVQKISNELKNVGVFLDLEKKYTETLSIEGENSIGFTKECVYRLKDVFSDEQKKKIINEYVNLKSASAEIFIIK